MIKSIIVEDQPVHSKRLKKLLKETDSMIEVEAVCTNVTDAIEAINTNSPQLVFLDICLQENDRGGFDVLKNIKEPAFDVVFTTAHVNEHIQDIRRCSIDFIMKPYVEEELADALKKFWEKRNGNVGHQQIKALLNNLFTDALDEQVIWLFDNDNYTPVKVKNIAYCESHSKPKEFTKIFFIDEESGERKSVASSYYIKKWE
jgi:two-component system LytT family response regulator